MPELIDHYFLVERRDVDFVHRFLDHYIPIRGGDSDYYLTEKNKETEDLHKLDDVLAYYEQNVYLINYVYITNQDDNSLITNVIVAYTDDAKAIFGLSVVGTFNDPDDLRRNIKIFNDVKLFIGAEVSCMTLEEPPPSNSIEFIEFAKQREEL